VLESSGDFSPLGSREVNTRPPVFRLISASKVPLAQSGLRTDLCERLAEGHMWRVPTLDERRDDIPGLMALFAAEQATLLGVPVVLGDEAVAVATGSAWPGQIRQLRATVYALAQTALVTAAMKNERPRKLLIRRQDLETHLAERHAAFGESARSAATTLPPAPVVADEPVKTRADPRALTRAQLQKVLDQVNGNQSQAARVLGIARNTLSRRMREFGIAEA
jgi:DNA-binding NtrC family response regulator